MVFTFSFMFRRIFIFFLWCIRHSIMSSLISLNLSTYYRIVCCQFQILLYSDQIRGMKSFAYFLICQDLSFCVPQVVVYLREASVCCCVECGLDGVYVEQPILSMKYIWCMAFSDKCLFRWSIGEMVIEMTYY